MDTTRGSRTPRLHDPLPPTLEVFRIAARFFHKTGLAVLVVLAATGFPLVGVFIAVYTALKHHGLDPAIATSLGEGIYDTLKQIATVFISTFAVSLAAMLAGDILTNTIRKRQATPLTPRDAIDESGEPRRPGDVHPSRWTGTDRKERP